MEHKNCSELSNSEIKIHLETLNNEKEVLIRKALVLKKEIEDINAELYKANNELSIRKNIF